VNSAAPIPTLETERLRLRPFTFDDEAAVFALVSDPEIARFVRFEAHRTPAETRAFLELVIEHYRRDDPFAWAIVRREDERLIGSCGFVSKDAQRTSAEIGYWLGTDRSEMIKGQYPELDMYGISRENWRGNLTPNSPPRMHADKRGLK